LGLDYFRVGLFAASFSIAAFIGSRFITPIIRKVGQTRMPFVGATLLSFSFALIWLIPNWIGLLAGFLVMGVGFSLIHTVLQTYATELLPAARGTCMSLFAFSFFLGNGIGPAFLGWIYEYFGPQGMFATTTVGLALFSVYCYFAFRRFTH
jgi:MFS family permease